MPRHDLPARGAALGTVTRVGVVAGVSGSSWGPPAAEDSDGGCSPDASLRRRQNFLAQTILQPTQLGSLGASLSSIGVGGGPHRAEVPREEQGGKEEEDEQRRLPEKVPEKIDEDASMPRRPSQGNDDEAMRPMTTKTNSAAASLGSTEAPWPRHPG